MSQPYENLTDLQIVALCVWREARGESSLGKCGVAHVIANRVKSPVNWWGTDWKSVVLKPWQFSSFNKNDPNASKWPVTESADVWNECLAAAQQAIDLNPDPTHGACWYHDKSISFPTAWGKREEYELTLESGRLLFYRKATGNGNHDNVQDAVAG